jgi:hypothetical protein
MSSGQRLGFRREWLEVGPNLFDLVIGQPCHNGASDVPAVRLDLRRRVDFIASGDDFDRAHGWPPIHNGDICLLQEQIRFGVILREVGRSRNQSSA